MAAPDLSPILAQQNSIYQQFAQQSAQNTFARNNAATMGQRQIADFQQGFGRSLPKFAAQWGRRGMTGGIGSGVQQAQTNQFIGDYTRDLGRLRGDIYNQDQQYGFNQAQFEAQRDQALASLQAQKAQLIASTAQHIAGLKPLMGG